MSNRALTAVWSHSQAQGTARLLLLAMADEANDDGLLAAYRRGRAHLCAKANISARSASRAVADLQALGELVVLRQGTGTEMSDYQLTVGGLGGSHHDTPTPASLATGGSHPGTPGGSQPDTPTHPYLVPPEPPTNAQPAAHVAQPPDLFTEWWEMYPRKLDKKRAEAAYRAAVHVPVGASPHALLQGLHRWVRYWRAAGTELQYVPHPTTWLRGRRWEAEPPPLPQAAARKAPVAIDTDRTDTGGLIDL